MCSKAPSYPESLEDCILSILSGQAITAYNGPHACARRGSKPLGNTCRTLMLIRAVRIYRAYGAHVPPVTVAPSSRYVGSVPSSMRGPPWYARRQAGPDMTIMSPERSKMGIGTTSRVRPPMRNIAAFPRLSGSLVSTK
jgi:hypothetical protein